MALFRFKWLRRFVRKRTNPIPEKIALDWKAKLSIAYMLIAWNAMGFVLFMCFTGKSDWPGYYGLKSDEEANKRPAIYFAELLKIQNARVISFSGLKKQEDFDYSADIKDKTNS